MYFFILRIIIEFAYPFSGALNNIKNVSVSFSTAKNSVNFYSITREALLKGKAQYS
jgi:hypothetical protein